MKSMPKDGRRLSLERFGRGGVHFKTFYCQGGVQWPYVIILRGTVLIHHAFLTPPPPPDWDVTNVRSLKKRLRKLPANDHGDTGT